jgi:hypothetical protein
MAWSEEVRIAVCRQTGGRCWYCGAWLDEMCIDHVVSRKHGGADDPENLVPACRACNSTKGSRSAEFLREFLAHRAAGAPRFTAEQCAWLAAHGLSLPVLPPYVFFGEQAL